MSTKTVTAALTDHRLGRNYQCTAVGVIPADWQLLSISEVASIYGRIGFRGYTVNDIVETGQGAISISPSNIQDNKITYSQCTYLSWSKWEESPEIKVKNGDVLLVKTGSTVGKTALVRSLPTEATVNPQLVVLTKHKIDSRFLAYTLASRPVQSQLIAMTVGGALPTLSQRQIANFVFPCAPTKNEQEAIAEALSDADALIESLEQLIAKKRAIKQGAMQELLTGRRRLPGFKGQWRKATLEDTCTFENGDRGHNYPSKSDFQTSGYAFVNAGHLDGGHIDPASLDFITKSKYDSLRGGKFVPRDILFCLRGSLGKFGVVNEQLGPGAVASSLVIIRSQPNIALNFLVSYFHSEFCKTMIDAWAGGAAQPNLGVQDLARFQIFLPPTRDEQEAIGALLSDAHAEIILLEAKLSKARSIKQGMMQELLTGRVRLA